MWNKLKKAGKVSLGTIVGGGLLGSALYFTSPQIPQLLKQHGYTPEDIEKVKMRDADPALYRALWEMHEHYANPKMSFKGNYSHYGCLIKNAITGDTSSAEEMVYPAGYNFNTNTIKVYNLDSLPFAFDHNFDQQELRHIINSDRVLLAYGSPLSPQRILLNNWIDELSYEDCYDEKGTVEYQAHKEIELDLIEEFIKLYALYADPQDGKAAWNLAKFYGGYFKNYDNELGAKKRLKICTTKFENPDAAFWLWNVAMSKFNKIECDKPEEAEAFLDEALERYTMAAEYGSKEGALKKWLQWMKYLVTSPDSPRDNMKLEVKKHIAFQELMVLDTVESQKHLDEKDSSEVLFSWE